MLRFGRLNGTHTTFYRPKCGCRRCTVCLPVVVGKKMSRVADEILYGVVVEAATFKNRLGPQLAGARRRGEGGDYVRIPVSPTHILIVSDAEVGHTIDRNVVEDMMFDALPEWGSITSSKGWRAVKSEPPQGFQDEGICTAVPEWVFGYAEQRMGLHPIERPHTVSYRTSAQEHETLKRAAGVKRDREFWEDVKALSHSAPKKFIAEFLARCHREPVAV